MKHFTILALVLATAACTPGGIVKATEPDQTQKQINNVVSAADFKRLDGDGWSGELSYLNYNSDERSSIPVELSIDTSSSKYLKYSIKYPGEEQYNDTSEIKFSKDGTKVDGKPVTSRSELASGAIQITTAYRGKDDNQRADIRMSYVISATEFRMKKDVKFDDQEAFFNRNEYVFTR